MSVITYPGINPALVRAHFSVDEWRIICNLGREWYVTHGGGTNEIRLGKTSIYRYFLMKPTNQYQELFNLEREIIVIFSPYETFQPRTLDAIEQATQQYQPLRIDRVCSVIISRDKLIESKLSNLLKGDPESQIVVPFTYDELSGPIRSFFIRNRFKKHFYSRDLFAFEAPLKKDLYFFGRSDLVHRIVNRHKSNENTGLFGLRKTGKTSVIYAIQRALVRSGSKSIYIDCQYPAFHRRRWNKALYYIIKRINAEYDLDLDMTPEKLYTEEDAALIFENEINRIHEELGKKNILLIFDEIENITFGISPSAHWANGLDFLYFWQTLRSLFQKPDNRFSFLIVGTNPLCIEMPAVQGKDNPIFNILPFEYIPSFNLPQTQEMVMRIGRIMGLGFDELIYGKLTEDYGGHPYLIRHVCSIMSNVCKFERPAFVNKTIYENAKEIFHREYSGYIEMILNILKEFYRDEYVMLQYLSIGDIKSFNEFAENSPHYTNHLLGYGIIRQYESSYVFGIEAVRRYLAEQQQYKKLDLTPSERLAEISERRNGIEPKLRHIVRTQLSAQYGASEARELALNIMGEPRKSKFNTLSYKELFDPNISQIYFDDLRKIVIRNWTCFQNIFGRDKGEFDVKMKAINKYRTDAHAKQIEIEDMAYFRVCMRMIEKYVDEYFD